ncbi:hypothetical protein KIPB_012717, partial [Kipferlia bialata]
YYMADVTGAVAALTMATQELLECALNVFETVQADLSVRCGLAVGPGFAAVLGRTRVSYDVFGMASSVARTLEGMSPVGRVTVCGPAYELLKGHQCFSWDSCPVSMPPSEGPINTPEPSAEPDTERERETEEEREFSASHAQYLALVSADVTLSPTLQGERETDSGPSCCPTPLLPPEHLDSTQPTLSSTTPTSKRGAVGECLHVRMSPPSGMQGRVLLGVCNL